MRNTLEEKENDIPIYLRGKYRIKLTDINTGRKFIKAVTFSYYGKHYKINT